MKLGNIKYDGSEEYEDKYNIRIYKINIVIW